MDKNRTTLERAFEIASSGKCNDLVMLRRHLKSEGYDPDMVAGPGLEKQLRSLMEKAENVR